MSEDQAEDLVLRADLKGDMKKKFLMLKKKWGLQNSSDVVRMVISRAYEEEFGKP